jgi:kynurenine formamidase
MRRLSLLLFLVFAVPVMAQRVPVLAGDRVVDLSHPFDANTVYWPTAEGFKLDTDFEGMTDKGYFYSAYRYSAAEHGGTHLDAPVHFAKGRHHVDEIPLEQLMGNGIVIDVTNQCANNPDYLVSVADFEKWERTNGRIKPARLSFCARASANATRIESHISERKNAAPTQLRSFTFRDSIPPRRVG